MTDRSHPSGGLVQRIDMLQRRRPALGFPYAVFKRYYEDHGGWLGSLVSYYGFFSLYPLLVVVAALATWVFDDRPETLQRILQAIWSKVPFATGELSNEVLEQVANLTGKGWVAAVSLIVSLWGGIGVVRVLQDTVNSIWGVPRYRRPEFFVKVARGLAIIGLLGVGVIGTAVVAGVTVGMDLPVVAAVGAALANIVLSTLITVAIYRLILGPTTTIGTVLPGSIITGVGTFLLTLLGGLYVQRVIARMTSVFGPFASTIGLLAYVSLTVQVFVLATEVNVVRNRRLWPRAITGALGPADRRALIMSMRREALSDPETETERRLADEDAPRLNP